MPSMVIQDNDRPYFGRVIMVAHQDSGFIFFFNLMQADADPHRELMQGISSAIEKHKILPSEVRFRKSIAAEAAKPLADNLGFKISLAKDLNAIDEARTGLSEVAKRGFPHLPG